MTREVRHTVLSEHVDFPARNSYGIENEVVVAEFPSTTWQQPTVLIPDCRTNVSMRPWSAGGLDDVYTISSLIIVSN